MLLAPAKHWGDQGLASLLGGHCLVGSEAQYSGRAALEKGTAASAGDLCTHTGPLNATVNSHSFCSASSLDCRNHLFKQLTARLPSREVPWAEGALLYVQRHTCGCQSV